MITFEHVTKVYPDGTHAVHDLTFDAPSGKLTVLVGPSGCGKTTSMRMINRLIDPTEGVVSLDGQDTRSVDAIELRRKIGYVIQSAGLFPHRTVVDNVAALPRLLGAGKKAARDSALELLAKVGLDERYARRYPYQLSGGQQQRVGVARALATDPPFLLMDEPFSAVDPVVRSQLQDSFLQLQRDIGKTIVMVTHDIDEALKLGDQVAVFREGGTLAQVDSPAGLLARPADPFVADFVGASRGYRALGFVEATAAVQLADEVTVQVGARPADLGTAADWCVVVDDDGVPLGWVDLRAAGEVVEEHHVDFSGALARADGSLRDLLDAALSSPTGRGLVTGPDGRLRGTVVADEVLRHIGRGRDAGREAEVAS